MVIVLSMSWSAASPCNPKTRSLSLQKSSRASRKQKRRVNKLRRRSTRHLIGRLRLRSPCRGQILRRRRI